MAKDHVVKFKLPESTLGNQDAIFVIKIDGEVLGKLKLSKGGFEWRAKHAKASHKLSWTQLSNLIEKHWDKG